ncbi:MAG TPA: GlsB/YeaQ/YmgE family stress response membrane protein [Kofleriaceae bacterium]|nr:GlsB/YeaQ/YmgE family stress response membrane protein [Kofleriaceae bacterium]
MYVLTWLLVGLFAGFLADTLVRESGFGIVGDVVLGILGALVGGCTFRKLGWHAPFGGLAGVIAVAFVGAVLVLALVRLIHSVVDSASRP